MAETITTSFLKLEGTLTDPEGNVVSILSLRGRFGTVSQDLYGDIVSIAYEMYPDDSGIVYTLKKKEADEAPAELHD